VQLAGRDIRVLCLSLGAGAAVASVRGAAVTIAGGPVDPESLSLFSAEAVDAVRAFRADVAVLSTCAVSTREGLTVMESDDAMVKRAIMASSTRRILPTAPSKITQTNTYRFGRIEDLDALLTTSQIDPDTLEELRAQKNPAVDALLDELDVLVDGDYRAEERDLTLHFRGSRNQRVIDLAATRATGTLTLLYADE